MGWLIFLAILLLLGSMPLGLRLRYDAGGAEAVLLVGMFRLRLYPMSERLYRLLHRPKKQKAQPVPQAPMAPPQPPPQKKPGGDWKRFLPLLQTGLDLLGDLRRKLRVDHLTFHLIMAGDDPADLAVYYGRAWAAVGGLMPQLDRAFVIKKRDVQVECDFVGTETRVAFAMDLTVTLGRLLGLAVRYGIRIIKQFLAIKKKKAVQVNE